MLLKWIGAGLIAGSCTGWGFLMARNYRKEERYLRQILRAVDTMVNELSCRRTPLPQLLRLAGETAEREVNQIFKSLAGELERQITPDAGSCMEVVLSQFPRLPEQSSAVLRILGRSLGRFDLEGQLRELDAVRNECGRLLDKHTADSSNRIRTYQTLGICAGAALAILFI